MSEQRVSGAAPQHLAQFWEGDTREPLPLVGEEREMLTRYLDWYRESIAMKCEGLSREQLSQMPVPPSTLSLHGLLRHLGGVERWWFRIQLAGEDVPLLHYSDDAPDQDFEWLDGDPAEALAQWREECARSRAIVAARGLDSTGVHRMTGKPVSVRRVLMDLTAEYARHCGHADLLRERLDGATGR